MNSHLWNNFSLKNAISCKNEYELPVETKINHKKIFNWESISIIITSKFYGYILF